MGNFKHARRVKRGVRLYDGIDGSHLELNGIAASMAARETIPAAQDGEMIRAVGRVNDAVDAQPGDNITGAVTSGWRVWAGVHASAIRPLAV